MFEVVPRPVTTVGAAESDTMTRRGYKTVKFPGCVAEAAIVPAPRASSPDDISQSVSVVEPPAILPEGTKRWFDIQETREGRLRTAILDGI